MSVLKTVVWLCLPVWMAGCTYTITLTSEAPGARVEGLKTGPSGLPVEVKVPWGPFVKRPITVSAPDHRTIEMDLGTRTVRSADFSLFNFFMPWRPPSEELSVVLVREHGLSGTWEPADVGIEQ